MKVLVASLYCGTGGHDKVYNIQLLPAPGGLWTVLAQYGGRGKGLTSIVKVRPTSGRAAHKKYTETLEEKLHKPRDPYHHTALSGKSLAHKDDVTPAAAPITVVSEPDWPGWDLEYAAAATALGVPLAPGIKTEPYLVVLADLALMMQDGLQDALAIGAIPQQVRANLSPACLAWFEQLPASDQRATLEHLQDQVVSLPF